MAPASGYQVHEFATEVQRQKGLLGPILQRAIAESKLQKERKSNAAAGETKGEDVRMWALWREHRGSWDHFACLRAVQESRPIVPGETKGEEIRMWTLWRKPATHCR